MTWYERIDLMFMFKYINVFNRFFITYVFCNFDICNQVMHYAMSFIGLFLLE